MSTIKTNALSSNVGSDLVITADGANRVDIETGFKVSGVEGLDSGSIRDGAVTTVKIADDAVTPDQIADNAVTSDKILDNAVTVAKMAGLARGSMIIGDASGNPVAVVKGSADQVFTSDGTDLAWATPGGSGGLVSVQVFEASGTATWTKPAGVSKVRIQLVGSGAHGSNGQQGGGAGGYAEKIVDVSSISSVTVTVGSPNGNTSSFGSHVSATGGYSAGSVQSSRGGFGGDGTGGDINIVGGGGGIAVASMSATGGTSYFGGCTPGSPNTTDATLHTYIAHGAGGMGVYNGYTQGSATQPGLVLVWEYA
ncbi:MAG: hypothetical protein CMO16_02880 [Thaumarchaeota archaeon]|nr:hypothetical protein [Nitrososphaerota archaeon]